MNNASARVNLAIPLDVAILIEKDCDKRGMSRTQFIKEAIYEKLKRSDVKEEITGIKQIKEEVMEVKRILMLLLDNHIKR